MWRSHRKSVKERSLVLLKVVEQFTHFIPFIQKGNLGASGGLALELKLPSETVGTHTTHLDSTARFKILVTN